MDQRRTFQARERSAAGSATWTVALVAALAGGLSAPSAVLGAPLSIGGRVVDTERQPLAGARVELYRSEEWDAAARAALEDRELEPEASARSDAEGRFRLVAPEPGMWRLVFQAPGRRTGELRLEPLFHSLELRPVVLAGARELTVRVRAPDGAPVAGALVMVRAEGGPIRDFGSEPVLPVRCFARADPRGVARIEGPADGEWSVDVAAPGWAPVALGLQRGDATTITLSRGRERRLEVRAAGGAPAAGAVVTTGGRRLPLGVADVEGGFVLAAPADRPLRVQADVPGASLGLAALEPAPPGAPAPPVIVRLETVELAGQVVRAGDRAPWAGAWVWDPESPGRVAVADGEGRYTLAVPPRESSRPGRLHAAAPDAFEEGVEVDPARAADGEGPTLALSPSATLAGVVLDADQAPVAAAEVGLRRSVRSFSMRAGSRPTRSGADGGFELPRVPEGEPVTVTARAEGFAPTSLDVEPIPAGERREIRVVLSAGLRALGTVVDLSDVPIAGAEVTLTGAAGGGQGIEALIERQLAGEDPSRAITDADGRFAIADLGPGRYDLEARAPGFAPARIPAVEVPAGEPETELGTVALSPGVAIEGVVRDPEGAPLEGVGIRKQEERGSFAFARVAFARDAPPDATTDADGRFRLEDLAEGATVTVSAELAGWSPTSVQGVRAPTIEPLELELSPASTLRGAVVDPLGEGIPRATVQLVPEMGTAGIDVTRIRSAMKLGTTDQEGRFELVDVVPGRYELRAIGEGFQQAERGGIEVAAGRDPAEVRVVLERAAALRGQVLDDAGAPVIGARITRVVQQRSPFDFGNLERGARTDADGRYRLDGLPTGSTSIAVEHGRHPRQVRDFVVQPGENLLDFRLASGHEIAGRVVDETGLPVAGATVGARAPSAGVVRTLGGGGSDPVTDERGEFTVEGLADGSYRVTARKQGYAEAATEELVRVEGRSVYGVELRLTVGAAVTGRILGLEFDDLSRVQVLAMQPGGGVGPAIGQVDYEGSYRLDNLSSGDWMVMATVGRGGRAVRETVTVEPGAVEVIADLEFGGGQAIRGQVVRAGEPVRGIAVFATGKSTTASSQATTDQDGRFVLEGLEDDVYRVIAAAIGSGASHEEEVEVRGADAEVLIELRESAIAGRVVDALDRAPVAGAELSLTPIAAEGEERFFFGFGTPPRSGEDGSFRLEGVSPGAWLVRATREGYAAVTAEVEVADGLDVEGLELELEPARGASLVVVTDTGRPADEVWIVALDGAERVVLQGSYRAGEGGVVRLDELPAGSWTVLVSTGASATTAVEVEAPADGVPVRLPEAGTLRVRVAELEGTGLQASARLLDGAGRPYRSAQFLQLVSKWTLGDGVGTLSQVPVGVWTLEVTTPDGARSWSETVRVIPGATLEVQLQ